MKFNCGPTWQERHDAKHQWHDWFAWRPVRLGESRDCRWLETLERKGNFYGGPGYGWWEWKYRESGHG